MPHQSDYGATPGSDIAQGAPADIGSLSPIVQLIKLLMGGMGQGQQQQPMPMGPPSLRNSMITQPPRRPEDLSGMGM